MAKFIEVQVVVRHGEVAKTQEALLNTDDICICTPYNGGTTIALRSVGNTVDSIEIELEDRYEDIRYKLFTDEVH